MTSDLRSLLSVVEKIDDFPYFEDDPEGYKKFMLNYYYFTVDGIPKPLGYMPITVVQNIPWPRYWTIDHGKRAVHLKCDPHEVEDVFSAREALINDTISIAKAGGKIPELKWRGEPCAVFASNGEFVCNMNNLGSQLFGTISFGVHLIAWTTSPAGRLYWLQRRSMSKPMHPGKLDTMAGGGIKVGESALEAMVRETVEEANIPTDFSLSNLKACGTVSYHLSYSFLNLPASNPHVLYAYEMELPPNIVPRPNDGEVSEFVAMTEGEVKTALFQDDMKPIIGVQWAAHFARKGILTMENEPSLLEICSRTSRRLNMFIV